MSRRVALVYWLVFLLAVSVSRAQNPSPNEELDSALPELMRQGRIPGLSIALVSGDGFWSAAYGVKSLETGEPVDENTIFEAASLSKPVFAFAVLRLVERGELDLDLPLAEILPDERMAHDDRYKAITGRMVLSHSTGLPNWGGDRLELNFDPGTNFNYSGEGFVYLQKALEKKTGLTLDQLVRREVFEPLGMKRSSYVWRDSFAANATSRHDSQGNVSPLRNPTEGNAAASLLTTASDYARFLKAVLQGVGLEAATREAMLSPESSLAAASWGDDEEAKAQLSWGLGWGLQPTEDGRAFWHWGDNGDAKAFTMVEIESGRGFVYFANSNDGLSIAGAVVDRVFAQPSAALRFLDYEAHDDPGRLARFELIEAFSKSLDDGRGAYRTMKSSRPSEATEETLARVGNHFLQNDAAETALAVFRLNAQEHPESWRAHDGLGEALLAKGRYESALASYQKALELDEDNEDVERKRRWVKTRVAAEKSPVVIDRKALESFAGAYGPRRVVLEGETLYYQRDGNPRYRLVPLASDLFALDGLETFRMRFVADDSGKITKIVGLYLGGNEDESPRDP